MIRITKYKTKAEVYGNGTIQEIYCYKAIDDDRILGTCAFQSDDPMSDNMAKIKLGQFVFRQIKIEEITEQENKELEIKNKIAVVDGDFE